MSARNTSNRAKLDDEISPVEADNCEDRVE
jgi:hypothetical protein